MFIIPFESRLFGLRYVYTVGRQKPNVIEVDYTGREEG